jgi:hypothetical protein
VAVICVSLDSSSLCKGGDIGSVVTVKSHSLLWKNLVPFTLFAW